MTVDHKWTLYLVRHCSFWSGSQFQLARAELFALIAKAAYSNEPVEVVLYTDRRTAERYYLKWLDEEGLLIPKLDKVICLKIVELDLILKGTTHGLSGDDSWNGKSIKQVYLSEWLPNVGKLMRENVETGFEVSNREVPGWLKKYLTCSQDFACKRNRA